jgi:Polysaccharide deacetylase
VNLPRPVVLHSVTGPPGTALAAAVKDAAVVRPPLRPIVAPLDRIVVRVSGPSQLVEAATAGLPKGAARPEGIAVRLRRAGVPLQWGEPIVLADTAAYIDLCHSRGESSLPLVRADPSLLPELQLGSFFHSSLGGRLVRRVLSTARLYSAVERRSSARSLRVAGDAAFWAAARAVATGREWHRLARSSYVALYYHRIAGEGKRGQERLDIRPRRFRNHLRLLHVLGWRPLSTEQLLNFHEDPTATLPPRAYFLTVDDAFRDAVTELRRHAAARPHVFPCTDTVGRRASWADGEAIAGWSELRRLEELGCAVGSHGCEHVRLTAFPMDALERDLVRSRRDLQDHLERPVPVLTYPHGSHDERVRRAAAASGFRAAFTTEPGRNSAGVDRLCLRRVGIKDWDGAFALLWKVTTGELVPWRLERLRLRLQSLRQSQRRTAAHASRAHRTDEQSRS